MEDLTRRGVIGGLDLASRRAEEAALRRYQAVHWLDYLVGPLGIPSQPSEKDFISCLRNGLILCKIMKIVQPGSVSKVVEKSAPSPLLWDSQPLPAYQYFENVRNFLVAVEELKLPTFDASVFERDNLEEGSSSKVVDCILALKAYHEWKQMTGGNGVYKPPKSPPHSVSRIHTHPLHLVSNNCSRKLDMSGASIKKMIPEGDARNFEDKLVKALEEHLVARKENMDHNLVSSYYIGNMDSVNSIKILTDCLEEQFRKTFPQINSSILDHFREQSQLPVQSMPLADLSNIKNQKCCRACLRKGSCSHWDLVKQQEKELSDIKLLLSSAKQEVELLQSQLHSDMKQLEDQVLEMSTPALGYHNAIKENRKLYNTVQDLKGSIRVYCRIRPTCNPSVQNIIDLIGEDGSLVIVDPIRQKDRKQMFQFNHVFGPAATQDDVFRDIQPLVRSVMDGYNVCIFAYGQTGSGKTHTLFCLPDGPAKESGISYLALNDLFELSNRRKDVTKYNIQVQMVEIYNEQVRDMLASDNNTAHPDATLLPVKSLVDVVEVMKLGEQNRAFGSQISRHSHCVLSIHVHGVDTSGSILRSCLHLVDLAGSEWADKSEATGDGLRDTPHTDKSLTGLIDVITALAQKHSHIPYQNSKLTLLLQDSLGGNAKTLMVAHVNPEGNSFEETMRILRFAQKVSSVELGAAHANKESIEVLELKAQLESLKKALGIPDEASPMKRLKEVAGTPCKKPKQMAERTPPRSRWMSIENGSSMGPERLMGAKTPSEKPKPVTERTPPSEKPKPVTERTPPPRSRRLSIESCTTTAPLARSMNHADKRAVKTPPARTYNRRRSSLEGPRNMQKDSCQIKLLDAITPEPRSLQNHDLVVGGKSPTKESNRSMITQSNQLSPRSPMNAALRSSVVRIDTAMMKAPPSLQTPEPKPRGPVQISESEILTPCSTQPKVSQTRKSLRNIGKLIKGSDKRKHKQIEAATPGHSRDPKSPTSSIARPPRRQSLTGIQPPGISSAYGSEDKDAKTPPRIGSSTKFIKRWL